MNQDMPFDQFPSAGPSFAGDHLVPRQPRRRFRRLASHSSRAAYPSNEHRKRLAPSFANDHLDDMVPRRWARPMPRPVRSAWPACQRAQIRSDSPEDYYRLGPAAPWPATDSLRTFRSNTPIPGGPYKEGKERLSKCPRMRRSEGRRDGSREGRTSQVLQTRLGQEQRLDAHRHGLLPIPSRSQGNWAKRQKNGDAHLCRATRCQRKSRPYFSKTLQYTTLPKSGPGRVRNCTLFLLSDISVTATPLNPAAKAKKSRPRPTVKLKAPGQTTAEDPPVFPAGSSPLYTIRRPGLFRCRYAGKPSGGVCFISRGLGFDCATS